MTREAVEAEFARMRAAFAALPPHTRWLMILKEVDSALGTGPCERVENTCDWCSEAYRHAVEKLRELREEIFVEGRPLILQEQSA